MATLLIIDEQYDLIDDPVKDCSYYTIFKYDKYSDRVKEIASKEQFDVVLLQFYPENRKNNSILQEIRDFQPVSCKFFWLVLQNDVKSLQSFNNNIKKILPINFLIKPITKKHFSNMFKGELLTQLEIDMLFV